MSDCYGKFQQRNSINELLVNIDEEFRGQCRFSVIAAYVEQYPGSLAVPNGDGDLPLHIILHNMESSTDLVLMLIEKYPAALQLLNKNGDLPLHIECGRLCRASIISTCIEQYPESLAKADKQGYLPLHRLLKNMSSSIDEAMRMLEKYPAAAKHQTKHGQYPIHIECNYLCRLPIISKCIELYVDSLKMTDEVGYLPLHRLLENRSSYIDDVALMMIDMYPVAVQHQDIYAELPLHLECSNNHRSSIIAKCIELYPEALSVAGKMGYLPFHCLLASKISSIDDAIMMIDKYPAAVQHLNLFENYPLHIECMNQCRSSIIAKCIELYPEALAKTNVRDYLPLHYVLENNASSTDDALMMIEKYPAALQYQDKYYELPVHIECRNKRRSSIIAKCIELYPESCDDVTITSIMIVVKECNFNRYTHVLSLVFAFRPMSLYDREIYVEHDIRWFSYYRRRILHLLPHHVFTPTHDADYRDLNWQPRASMIMLLSQMKIQQQNGLQQE
jgi:ankyrin repeat protein